MATTPQAGTPQPRTIVRPECLDTAINLQSFPGAYATGQGPDVPIDVHTTVCDRNHGLLTLAPSADYNPGVPPWLDGFVWSDQPFTFLLSLSAPGIANTWLPAAALVTSVVSTPGNNVILFGGSFNGVLNSSLGPFRIPASLCLLSFRNTAAAASQFKLSFHLRSN